MTNPTYEDFATATPWRPDKADDKVSGTVAGFSTYTHQEYGKSPVVYLNTDNGFVSVYAIHGVMLNRLMELRPQVGEKLTLIYTGEHESRQRRDKNGDPVKYSGYVIYTGDGDTTEFQSLDWSQF